jgi:hypothetical protein
MIIGSEKCKLLYEKYLNHAIIRAKSKQFLIILLEFTFKEKIIKFNAKYTTTSKTTIDKDFIPLNVKYYNKEQDYNISVDHKIWIQCNGRRPDKNGLFFVHLRETKYYDIQITKDLSFQEKLEHKDLQFAFDYNDKIGIEFLHWGRTYDDFLMLLDFMTLQKYSTTIHFNHSYFINDAIKVDDLAMHTLYKNKPYYDDRVKIFKDFFHVEPGGFMEPDALVNIDTSEFIDIITMEQIVNIPKQHFWTIK